MNIQESIKFTVIIPTRERADTLESSLRTCVTQDYDNLEILVSDNFSQDNTREVVESFRDKRIRYVNTGRRLSMSHNWEFALSLVKDGYVMILGDDDGLLPEALRELNTIICETNCVVIAWEYAMYWWPNVVKENSSNVLRIPLKTLLTERNAEKMLTALINCKESFHQLPSLYKGFVNYSVIEQIRQESGKFFHSMTPDVYSAVALSSVVDSYYYSLKPFSLAGLSAHSTGIASFFAKSRSKPVQEFFKEENIPFHEKLVSAPSIHILVIEALWQAQKHLTAAQRFQTDLARVLHSAVKQASHASHYQYEQVINAVKTIADLNQIDQHVISQMISLYPHKPLSIEKPCFGYNIIRGLFLVDCEDFGVQDVYGASLLCKHILTLEKCGFYSIRGILNTTFRIIKRKFMRICGKSFRALKNGKPAEWPPDHE